MWVEIIFFSIKVVCIVLLLLISWRPYHLKEYWQSRKLEGFEEGVVIINGKQYKDLRYKNALCWNLSLPPIVFLFVCMSGVLIFSQVERSVGYEILNFVTFYVPIHNIVCGLDKHRQRVINTE